MLVKVEAWLIAHEMHLSKFNKKIQLDVNFINLTESKPEVDAHSLSKDPYHSPFTTRNFNGFSPSFQFFFGGGFSHGRVCKEERRCGRGIFINVQ